MVATLAPLPVPASALADRGGLVRFTVDAVQAMLRAGLLPEDATTELLDGCIVHIDKSAHGQNPTTHSPAHRYTVRRLTALAAVLDTPDRHVQIQLPIICGPAQMPEPDFAVIRGTNADYMDRLPTAADDVMCVIEVSDSSLERDRDEKRPVYARAGVPQYVILNLRNRTAEVYADPDRSAGTYAAPTVLAITDALDLRIGQTQTMTIALAGVLPGPG